MYERLERERLEKERQEIEQARARQVYDCVDKTYDERKQRVTDLKECTRIFLPKPLQVDKEAQLETRRELHQRVSENYRRENCNDRGAQESNLTQEEMRGIRKLEQRKNSGELVVIMTDKSSKLCVMKRSDYLLLGEEHVGKDKIIERTEVMKIEKILNNHAVSWCKMWRTGADHDHED